MAQITCAKTDILNEMNELPDDSKLRNLFHHTQIIHRNYFCVDCKCVTQNPRVYLEHRRDYHHDSITIYECDLCIYASKHAQKLARHRRTVHRNIIDAVATSATLNQSLAKNTPVYTANNDGIDNVIRPGKRLRTSSCKLCEFASPNKIALIDHIRAMHKSTEIFECDRCSYSHYMRDRFNRHRKYHSMDQVKCEICDFKTIYKWNMERHVKHHVDDNLSTNSFCCTQCNFKATTKQSVTAHESVHHEKRNNEQQLMIAHDPVKQEKNSNDLVNDQAVINPIDFLELVWNYTDQPSSDDIKTKLETLNHGKITIASEVFFCQKCNFKNEIKIPASIELQNQLDNNKDVLTWQTSKRYQCGHCHQTSNWKHVIERHCRLVHQSNILIQRFCNRMQIYKDVAGSVERKTADLHNEAVASSTLNMNIDYPDTLERSHLSFQS